MSNSLIVYACLGLGLSSALVGGVFQRFSDFVMRGLVLTDGAGGPQAMQQINRTVMRSSFLFTFLALAPVSVLFALYAFAQLDGLARNLIVAAGAVYVIAVFLVTIAGNVPMNSRLAAFDPYSPEAIEYWATYGKVWTRWNHVRTIGSIVTAGCYLLASTRIG